MLQLNEIGYIVTNVKIDKSIYKMNLLIGYYVTCQGDKNKI